MTEQHEDPAMMTAGGDQATSAGTMSVLTLLLQQLGDAERRITKKIDDNAAASSGHWKSHGEAHEELEGSIRAIGERVTVLERDDERDKLIWDTRVGPFKRIGAFLAKEWRTLLFAGAFVVTWIVAAVERG